MTSHCPSESSAVGYFALVRGFVVFGAACLQHSRGTHPLTESFCVDCITNRKEQNLCFLSLSVLSFRAEKK